MSELQTNIDKPIQINEDPGVELIRALYAHAGQRLEAPKGSQTIHRESIVDRVTADYDRNLQTVEALTQVIVIGETLIGVSMRHDVPLKPGTKIVGDGDLHVRLAVLPFGVNANLLSARTVADVNLDSLRRSRPSGYVQEWEDISLGREVIAHATGVTDATVSASHAAVRISADGKLEVLDRSRNGTAVIDSGLLFDPGRKDAYVSFVRTLQAGSQMWSPDTIAPTLDDTIELDDDDNSSARVLVGAGVLGHVNGGSLTGVEQRGVKAELLKSLISQLDLTASDKDHLDGYARSKARQAEAQQAGDGQGSRDAQEAAGWHYGKISPAAKAIADRYVNIANQ